MLDINTPDGASLVLSFVCVFTDLQTGSRAKCRVSSLESAPITLSTDNNMSKPVLPSSYAVRLATHVVSFSNLCLEYDMEIDCVGS